jgi:hypothetical protein
MPIWKTLEDGGVAVLGRWLINLNATAANVWKHCDGKMTVEEIADVLHKEFPEQSPGRLYSDVSSFLVKATQHSLVIQDWDAF